MKKSYFLRVILVITIFLSAGFKAVAQSAGSTISNPSDVGTLTASFADTSPGNEWECQPGIRPVLRYRCGDPPWHNRRLGGAMEIKHLVKHAEHNNAASGFNHLDSARCDNTPKIMLSNRSTIPYEYRFLVRQFSHPLASE